jgi:riboflavin kinase / FMN adenylyltransferase
LCCKNAKQNLHLPELFMKVHHDLISLPTFINPVITIGTFDGVHFGHRKILKQLKQKAKEIDGQTIVISFEPHPRLVVNPEDTSLKILTTLAEKINILSHLDIDHFIIVPFTKQFMNQSATQYIQDFLIANFQPHTIIIGFDHQFGKNREGNLALLHALQTTYHYQLIEIEKQLINEIDVSSTIIRKSLIAGDLKKANAMLQHAYSLTGTVVHGDERGRTIGYPTANINVHNKYKLIPGNGVYAIKAIFQGSVFGGMMNIGTRPTIEQTLRISLEAHLFEFDKMIYDENITIEFVEKMREEIKFNSFEELVSAIKNDEVQAKKILAEL